jgi:hypothetical protein
MVTKKKSTSSKSAKKGRVKIGKLKLSKETIKDLTDKNQSRVKGGARPRINGSTACTLGYCQGPNC